MPHFSFVVGKTLDKLGFRSNCEEVTLGSTVNRESESFLKEKKEWVAQ